MRSSTFSLLLVATLFAWAGLTAGISFLEAPLKFTAPHITVPLGVGIGRVVFHALNRVEMVLSLLALMSAGALGLRGRVWIPLLTALLVLAAQTLWLLPLLDVRATALLAGEVVPPSQHHLAYIGLEATKVLALLVAGGLAFSQLQARQTALPARHRIYA